MGKGTEVLVAVSIHLQSNPRQPFGRYKDKAAIQTSRPSPGTRISPEHCQIRGGPVVDLGLPTQRPRCSDSGARQAPDPALKTPDTNSFNREMPPGGSEFPAPPS